MKSKREPKRSYGQFCPLARSLDILGERWTLLIVRNLLVGPQRYKDLLDGLPGIGTNLLATRLKELEKEGIIQRRTLPPPAGSTVYELTELGWGLEEPVIALGRWGTWTLAKEVPNPEFRPLWAGVGMRIIFRPDKAEGVHETYEVRIDTEVFHLRVDDGRLEVERGSARQPDLVMSCDTDTRVAMGSPSFTPADALATGRLKIEGSPGATTNFARIFRPPTATSGPVNPEPRSADAAS
jgi:DNA-binding HxlR family transcriptional regulator